VSGRVAQVDHERVEVVGQTLGGGGVAGPVELAGYQQDPMPFVALMAIAGGAFVSLPALVIGIVLAPLARRARITFALLALLVFAHPQSGRPLDRTKLTRKFKAACVEAGVRPIRFHDLRHTFATRLAASGQPMRTIQEFLGHADSKTTQIYAHYAPSAHEVEMVNAAFAEEEPAETELQGPTR
jgi:hypothetical protein